MGAWRVVDGDTLWTPEGERLRLAAIDAPEVGAPGGARATAFVRAWLADASPRATWEGRDRYGRLLGDLSDGRGESLAGALVGEGLAWVREPGVAPALLERQAAAVEARRGVHAGLAPGALGPLVVTPERFHAPRCPWVRRHTAGALVSDDVVRLLQSGRAPCRTCLPWPPSPRDGAPPAFGRAAETNPLSSILVALSALGVEAVEASEESSFAKLIALGVVQGLTEFLPVSSSGHLVLGGAWLGMGREGGLLREVALHLGTLASVLVFCWRDLVAMLRAGSRPLWAMVLVSAAVTAPIGLALEDTIEARFTHPIGAGIGLMLTATLIGWIAPRDDSVLGRSLDQGTVRDGVILGLLQSLALIPGVSRAGATITAALLLGFRRPDAVRIAFLMSVPVVAGAVVLKFAEPGAVDVVTRPDLLVAMAVASVVGFVALRFIAVHCGAKSLRRFALYCLTVGVIAIISGAL